MYLEGFPRKYVAAQLHLHWGETGSLGGSEHQINSEATAAEVLGNKAWARTQGQAWSAPRKGRIWKLGKVILGG